MALAAAGGFDDEQRARSHRGEMTYRGLPDYCWEAEARLAALDADSIAHSVLYPTMLLTFQHLRSLEFAEVQCRAYNDWAWETFGPFNDRLIPLACIASADIEGAIAEIQRCAGFVAAVYA